MSEATPAERARMIATEILGRHAKGREGMLATSILAGVRDAQQTVAQACAAVDLANAVMEPASKPVIGDIWLHDDGEGNLEVWAEVDGTWRVALKDVTARTNLISHWVDSENAREWPLASVSQP